jgi:hypothetical protein
MLLSQSGQSDRVVILGVGTSSPFLEKPREKPSLSTKPGIKDLSPPEPSTCTRAFHVHFYAFCGREGVMNLKLVPHGGNFARNGFAIHSLAITNARDFLFGGVGL